MGRIAVTLAVADAPRFDEIVEALAAHDFEFRITVKGLGVINGTIAEDRLETIRRIEGLELRGEPVPA